MVKLKIVEKNGYDYVLEDIKGKKYNLNIDFYVNENIPKIGDHIYLNEKIVKEINIYTFGPINGNKVKEDELIKIVSDDKEYYLQRYYG